MRYLYCFLLLSISMALPAQSVSFDLTTTPQTDGSLTKGYFIYQNESGYGLRLDYKDRDTFLTDDVDGTDLSLLYTRTDRRQVDCTMSLSWSKAVNLYGGISYLTIEELQESVFYVNDYVTEYDNTRDAAFFSPRVGFSYSSEPGNHNRSLFNFQYSLMVSPLYFFTMDQEMTFDYIDDPFENSFDRWSGPYFEHSLDIQVTRYLRFSAEHSFLYLDYQSLYQNDNGNMVTGDDPVIMNDLSLSAELTLPVNRNTSVKIGIGKIYDWQYFASDEIDYDDKTLTSDTLVLRIGAGSYYY